MASDSTPSAAGTALSPAPKNYLMFVVFIAIIGAFSSLVNDMYLPTIPSMMKEFHTTPSMTQMGISMAMLGMGLGSIVWGSASDRYGRKPVLIISLIVFVAATALSLFSRSITFFIVCRLFQGVGAGGAMVLSTSIPADVYMGRQLAKLMAVIGAINGIAPALGPVLGGFMADWVGWRGIFVVLLVIGVIMTFWTTRYRETLPPQRRLSSGSMSDYIKAYRALLTNGRFMIYVTIKAVAIGLLYAYISSAPFIIQTHYGFSAMEFGLIFGGNALAISAGSTLALKFKVMKQGMVVGCVGMFITAVAEAFVMWNQAPFWLYELAAVPMLLFSGMIFSSSNTLSMEVGRQDAGTASAILSVVKYVFAAIVSPLVGLGNMFHSAAIAFVVVTAISLVLAWKASRLPALADMERK
ncbi:MAG: multidrug effflux MFS transporter [Bacteroides sp.]|nr:multidrug effflux MFS transporter [Barnesiella sp.]MBD5369165.1 multidrug effflux MFS transporter [Bacteroides sp.]